MNIKLMSTKEQLEEFKESFPWLDIKNELNNWKSAFIAELQSIVDDAASTNPTTASVLMHLGDINGRIKAVDYMLNLPNLFISIKEDEKNDSQRNSTN